MKNKNYITDPIESLDSTTNKPPTPPSSLSLHNQSIYDYTIKFIEEVQSLTVTLPLIEPFVPIEKLKEIPRTGKAIRLKSMQFESIKPRSIYDHIMSMAYLADSFLGMDKKPLIEAYDYPNLGRLIAYHEVNESLVGDIPAYTDITGDSLKDKNNSRIKAINPDKREKIVNEFLWMYANDQQRSSIKEMNRNLSNQNTALMKYFRMLDRIDPIVAIWKYIHKYREILQANPREFINGMNDFFVYPKTTAYQNTPHSIDFPYLQNILPVLMDPQAALKYCNGTPINDLFKQKKKAQILKNLIEEVPLFFND